MNGLLRVELRRKLTQSVSLVLGNLYFEGWARHGIYGGPSKAFCFPGLHCYSCPSSVLSCPVGSLQNLLASPAAAFAAAGSRDAMTVLAVLGFILATGFIAGRMACSHLCPFGLLQELLYMLPAPKVPFPESLGRARYAMLAVFVLALPLFLRTSPGLPGDPWFCKAVCPAGTILAGWPLVAWDSGASLQTGFLFGWKSAVAVAVILWAIVSKRPFCRALCPLGAAWGLTGRLSIWRMRVADSCIRCGKCRDVCPVEIHIWKKPDSTCCLRCGRCTPVCPVAAISHRIRS